MNLPKLAIDRPVLVTVAFLIITLLGAVSFLRLPVDLMPDVSMPTLTVRATYTGVGPQEMEELVSVPLERALASTPAVREITSTSSEGSSSIRLSFDWGTDLDAASDEVRTRIDRTRGQLPEDAETPTIFKFDVNSFPIVFLGVSGEMDARSLRDFTENQIQYRFERIPGVAQADIWGGLSREIHVKLKRGKMNALKIDPAQVVAALRRENLNEAAGQVDEGSFEVLMRTQGEYRSLEQIANSMIAVRNGDPVYVRDIAEVEDSHQEVRNLVRIDRVPGLRMGIRKQSNVNTVDVARAVQKEVERINSEFSNIHITLIADSSRFIEQAVANVRDSALYGSLLAVLILLLFLRNVRTTLIIAITIPISVIATFGLMFFYGFTLNTVTFGGLALGVGILVDNSIVVLENIFRHRQDGQEKLDAARTGTNEVATAITASTLTTIVVFIPVVFMTGMTGVMFQQLAWVVSFSLFSSLAVALTLIPLLSSRIISIQEPNTNTIGYKIIHSMAGALDRLDQAYARGVEWALRHSLVVIGCTLALFLGSLQLVQFIGFELQPETDEGEVQVNMELPAGSKLETTDALAMKAEEIIVNAVPEQNGLMTEVGSAGGWRSANTNTASVRVRLVDQKDRTRSSQQVANDLRPIFARFPGVITRIQASGGNRALRMTRGDSNERLSIDVRAYDLTAGFDTAVLVKRMLEETEGVTEVRIDRTRGRAENRIHIDREKAATMGLSVSAIAANVRTSIGGTTATYFREGGKEYPIVVRYDEGDRQLLEDVLAVPIQTPRGLNVPLKSLISLDRSEGPTTIQRKDQQRITTVMGNLSGDRDMGSIVLELQERFRELDLPPSTALIFSGEWEEQQEAFVTLQLSMILAITLVYLVMAAQFESFKSPFLIMFSLPLATIGVILMLFLTDTTFNMQAFIGAIMLVGIVVNNAIVLVDYVLQLRRDHGMNLREALITGGRRRLRPILMTTLTTVLGLIPMSLGIGEGGELQAPMARVLIGGLVSSTFITLFFIPTLFMTLERVGARRKARRESKQPGFGPTSPEPTASRSALSS